MTRRSCLLLLGFAALVTLPLAAQDAKKDDLNDLLDGTNKGPKFRLASVAAPERNLGEMLYWRTNLGTIAAQTTPVRFRADGTDVIAPVLNTSAAADGKTAYTYPIEARVMLKPGEYTLKPGSIPFKVTGTDVASSHPAIKVVGGEVRILCAPVRLDCVDERGVPVATPIRVYDEKDSLLRDDGRFTVLTLWLPISAEYHTSLGSFALTAEGKIKAGKLAADVKATADGLRKIVPAVTTPMPTAAETLTLKAEKTEACRVYLPPVVRPGEPLRVAVSLREYQQATGKTFAAADIKLQVEDGSPVAGQAAAQVSDELRSQAEKAFRTPPDDHAWQQVPLPANAIGPRTVMLQLPVVGSARAAVLVADVGGLTLVPHRWRTVFSPSETSLYQLVLPRGTTAGEAQVTLQNEAAKDRKPIVLGKLTLPAVDSEHDARLFTVRMADLPLGRHQLWVEAGAKRSGKVPVTVVSEAHLSSFFTHSMSGCTTCWPTSDEGLDVLQNAGLEMASATGFNSQLDTRMPRVDATLAARLQAFGLPAEAALQPTANDRLLERLLKHRLRLIDLAVVRDQAMYCEGLSYHHSYQPSVDRMVRRMQLFTQQTADYPSFWGVNYSWFPALYGYAEGGVPTDAHVQDRNKTLQANVLKAGFPALSREDRDWLSKHKSDPQERDKVLQLMATGIAHSNAMEDFGWAKHNALYNQAIHDVRPGTVCTLFENAGHDEGKRLRSMYHAMNAQCFESYTDYGDWPMSSAFVTDWSHGQSPGQPVWLTTCWGTSSEGKMKSLFHAFARGLEGGGVPMEGNFDLGELARRGKGLRFVSQYGAVAKHATPDRRVAILSRSAHRIFGRMIWDCHAAYYYLTRLGFPPIVIADDELKKAGLPDGVRVLLLVKEELPLEPETKQALEKFTQRGGKVVTIGCTEKVAGAVEISQVPKHMWELKGFHPDNHQLMWQEFEKTWQPALDGALTKTGVTAAARTNPALAIAAGMDAGAVRYVAVMSDLRDTHSNHFEPTTDIPLSLEGAGWTVRDLVKQKTLTATTKDGRTETHVDLVTEPTTLLALYRSAPAKVRVESSGDGHLGGELVVRCGVSAVDGSDLGAVPISCTLIGPDGSQREQLFRAAADVLHFPLAAHDQAGNWRITVQELLTGVTAVAEISVGGAETKIVSTAQVGDVHIVNAAHLQQFVARPGERVVIVEPEQAHLLPLAEKLTEALKSKGVSARLWQVRPEEYDTHPMRWYPTTADEQRLKDIEAGKLIGVRENLTAYIDKVKRAHIPERGGYAETGPVCMVGRDCIVFSGGRLAESLRGVTPWMPTPHVPGKGQGRLVVCFSPFMANRQAVAVLGNDVDGLTKAAHELTAAFANKAPAETKSKETPPRWQAATVRVESTPVPQPFVGFTPLQRVARLLANADGQAAVLLRGKQDNVALVDGAGKLTATLALDTTFGTYARLDSQGRLQLLTRKVTALHPGWGFPTEAEFRLQAIAPDGHIQRELLAYTGPLDVPDLEGGLRWAADGTSTAIARPGGLRYQFADSWKRYDDMAHVQTRFGVLYPRYPVGSVFSPDGRYLLFTMDSRPPFGGLGSPTAYPTDSETVLLDLKTGERVWSLAGKEKSKSAYAIHTGFAALSRDASVAALADYDGSIHLVDRSGKVLVSEKVIEPPHEVGGRMGPPDGIGVCLSDTGRTAVFAFRRQLVIISEQHVVHVPVDGVTSAAVSPDGSLVVAGCGDGRVRAFDPAGKSQWDATPRGATPLVAAAGSKGFLVATGEGDLVLLGGDGKEARRTAVAVAADKGRHEPQAAANLVRQAPPIDYVEPETLALARKQLGAKEIDAWKPSGAGRAAFGRTFHAFDGKAELSAKDDGDFFVHLVYRRPTGNKSLRLMTDGKDGPETFWLDLPTREYRVVDVPLRGPKARVTLLADGAAEVAELSLWSLRWPSGNLAYVRPAGVEGKPTKDKDGDDILGELDGKKPVASGKLKDCRIWWPNTDVDAIRGPWLPAPVDPLQIVDGKRFGGGKIGPFSDKHQNTSPTRGGFFTVDFGEVLTPSLVATYDRAVRQSEVCVNLVAFRLDAADALQGGALLSAVVGNDQFWRLLPLKAEKVKVLGVHVIKDSSTGSGLSEVEVYK
jgi:hypothetical protein